METNEISPGTHGFDNPESIINHIDTLKKSMEAEGEGQKNPFPIWVFPAIVQEIIRVTNKCLNFPLDFIGAAIMFAVSVAAGNTFHIKVKNSWTEHAVLFLALVGRPGTNKSHPLSFAIRPLATRDVEYYKKYQKDKAEYIRQQLQKSKVVEEEFEEPLVKPKCKKTLISDFTPEALANVLKDNVRGLGIYADELAGWLKNFNRYNAKGSDQESYMSIWSGKELRIDRKTDDPILIPNPFVSLAGTIQNGVLNELTKDSRASNGFNDRILFVIPDELKKPYWNDHELDVGIEDEWDKIIMKLLNEPLNFDETGNPEPCLLRMTVEAQEKFKEWSRYLTDKCNSVDESEAGVYSKYESYTLRFALILELLSNACDGTKPNIISRFSVEGAIQLVKYFIHTARQVQAILNSDDPLTSHTMAERNLYKDLPQTFTTGEGVEIASKYNIPDRTFKRLLKDKQLFTRLKHGIYEKNILD